MGKSFNHLTRGYTLSMSIMPFLVVLACAIKSPLFIDGRFIINSILCLAGILLVHMAVNLYDDIVDIEYLLNKGINFKDICFSNKRKACAILNGSYSLKEAKIILYIILFAAFLCGLYFVYLRGGLIILFMLLAILAGMFYPKSANYGLSELTVGLVFGPLLVNSAYFAITGYFNISIYYLSFAIGIMTTILLITHSLMDYEDDKKKNKKTLPVMLDNKNLTINVISLLILLSFAILYKEGSNMFRPQCAVFIPILLTLPVSVKLILSLYEYIQIKDVKFIPEWYFGRMENWEEIKSNNMEYFMFRFYLSRNLATIFNATLAIVCLLAFDCGFREIMYFKFDNFIF